MNSDMAISMHLEDRLKIEARTCCIIEKEVTYMEKWELNDAL